MSGQKVAFNLGNDTYQKVVNGSLRTVNACEKVNGSVQFLADLIVTLVPEYLQKVDRGCNRRLRRDRSGGPHGTKLQSLKAVCDTYLKHD
jgi:hypothetical protein